MATRPLSLVIIDLQRADEIIRIEVPKTPNSEEPQTISNVFADPTGRHLVVTLSTQESYYLSTANLSTIATTPRKPRLLRLRHPISAIAWPPRSPSGTASIECLIGSSNGAVSTLLLPPQDDIFNLKSVSLSKSVEKDHTVLYTLPDGECVAGVGYGFWKVGTGQEAKKGERKVWVVLTTKHRMYEFSGTTGQGTSLVGKGGWGEDVFRPYRDSVPSELPFPAPSDETDAYR